jgi:hypothetical protein
LNPLLEFQTAKNRATSSTPEPQGLARCPACQTTESGLTMAAVQAGASWRCARCTQRWDAIRLTAVAGYLTWLSGHSLTPVDRATLARSGM